MNTQGNRKSGCPVFKYGGYMGQFDGILLMTDFDGTLGFEGRVSKENTEAIRTFMCEGGAFAIASGRSDTFLSSVMEEFLPNAPCVFFNGAVIASPGSAEPLFQKTLDDGVLDFAEAARLACPKLNYLRFHTRTSSIDIPADRPLDPDSVPRPIYKMIYHVNEPESDDYLQTIAGMAGDRYAVSRSWINGIELLSSGATKGDAVPRLRAILGERARTVVAVGDYENDIGMLRTADIGYAVGNAIPAVKAASNRITVPCREHALAAVIADLRKIREGQKG